MRKHPDDYLKRKESRNTANQSKKQLSDNTVEKFFDAQKAIADLRITDEKQLQLFSCYPTLADLFEHIPADVSFNLEMKYPEEPETEKAVGAVERNLYVDTILKTVFEHAGNRVVIISSFDPDICMLARRKQLRYPVLLLTDAGVKPNDDERKNTLTAAIDFVRTYDLVGIVTHSRPLLQQLDLVPKIHSAGKKIGSFSGDNNEVAKIRQQMNAGVDFIISDEYLAPPAATLTN